MKPVFFHIDIDSPATLLRFWDIEGVQPDLGHFYDTAMSRALALMKEQGVPATFFCVGRELDEVPQAAHKIREAFDAGHEIANHTYTHPYGLSRMSRQEILSEVKKCSDAIRRVTGQNPVGFRAPSYDLSGPILDVLEELSFTYDSSAYWSSLMPLMKIYHRLFSRKKSSGEFGHGSRDIPIDPYRPSRKNWLTENPTDSRKVLEIPLARSAPLQLPFYNNFHLMVGDPYRNISTALTNHDTLVYLIHLIEFMDLEDKIPNVLSVHPNLKISAAKKIQFLSQTMRQIKKRYRPERSDRFAAQYRRATQ